MPQIDDPGEHLTSVQYTRHQQLGAPLRLLYLGDRTDTLRQLRAVSGNQHNAG